ncbi:MAG: YdjY domain-containing protein [Phycisphaerales bacterium]
MRVVRVGYAVMSLLVACAPTKTPIAGPVDARRADVVEPPPATAAPTTAPEATTASAPTTSASPSVAAPTAAHVAAPTPVIHLPGGIDVDRGHGEVRLPAEVATAQGWLEAVACGRDSREHESLLVVDAKPSQVHAALLALGLVPGAPGRWHYDSGNVELIAPTGPSIVPIVRWSVDGRTNESPLLDWIHGADGRAFPGGWVFAGSRFVTNVRALGPGEHYEADFTGSLVGLVTFGDETIGAVAVIPDQVAVERENWEAWTERMPPSGTPATLILRRADSSDLR